MHLHWERSSNTAGDCIIRSLSWMGRVPDEIPQEEGWKLSRNHYYQEGWLSSANLRGVVGVTYTSSLCGEGEAQLLPPARTNYNLRGHRAEVTLVRWNEPYQKLASCDTSGIIFVWIKYEGRWSIELINDRNTPVICFSWSHDGRMALICYQDGFVLVGSVAGQRYWSTLLPADVNNITSGVWTPDDQHVYLGTSQGDILAMDIEGNTVGRVTLQPGVTITDLSWNCERFNMEEQPEQSRQTEQPLASTAPSSKPPQQCLRSDGKPYVLAAALRNGNILLLRSYDDVIPQVIKTGFQNFCMDWNNSGSLLTVAGKSKETACRSDHSIRFTNTVQFYNENANLILKSKIPCETSPVTALTWGHNDKRLFVATGNQIHIGWISSQVASLQLLSRLKIHSVITTSKDIEGLPLPCRMQNLIGMLFTQTIRCCIPNPNELRDFVLKPQSDNTRLHCTMIRHTETSHDDNPSSNANSSTSNAENSNSSSYTLYLEHLGGFLPLLKGKKMSKIKPEFVIYDPQLSDDSTSNWLHFPSGNHLRRLNVNFGQTSNSETETDDDVHSPRLRRRRRRRRGPLPRYGYIGSDNIDYMNILPESNRLAEVSSNIWGTKFKIVGLNPNCLPSSLGQINYKASLLHLQPRQMRVEIVDLKDESGSSSGVDWSGEDLLEDDWQSDEFESQGYASTVAGFVSDEDEERENGGVTMKDDILTAVTTELNIVPIAPLPSRLSFCIGPRPTEHQVGAAETRLTTLETSSRSKTAYDNELYISSAIVHEIRMLEEEKCENEIEVEDLLLVHSSPNKAGGRIGYETTSLSLAKRSPTIVPGRKAIKGDSTLVETAFNSFNESPTCHKVKLPESLVYLTESPSKQRRLRVSVSCDNYLSDAKFALSRRDSVGSGSPHSAKGSPLRWATKADELATMMTTSLIAAPQKEKEFSKINDLSDLSSCQRSCSANELDAIVDILGVPSEILCQRDFNKRLILMATEKSNHRIRTQNWREQNPRRNTTGNKKIGGRKHCKKIPNLDNCGKSKSFEDCPVSPIKTRKELEAKRRSIYGHECKGRSEAGTCSKCQTFATQVNDLELNREIFDIPTPPQTLVLKYTKIEEKKSKHVTIECEEESDSENKKAHEQVLKIEEEIEVIVETEKENAIEERLPEISITNEDCSKVVENDLSKLGAKSPKTRRRFDSVKNLLEKARQKLLMTKHFLSHNSSHESKKPKKGSKPDLEEKEHLLNIPSLLLDESCQSSSCVDSGNSSVTQSSPSTPAQSRKNNFRRNRSFSPVRSFLNSPLIRRRKKTTIESSEEDVCASTSGLANPDPSGSEGLTGFSGIDDEDEEEDCGQAVALVSNRGYHNLETFQRKKLKQKLKKLSHPNGVSVPIICQASTTSTTIEHDEAKTSSSLPNPKPSTQQRPPYPSPPPAPQRVPHPPGGKARNVSHTTKTNSSNGFSPFLGRKGRLFGAFPSTPNSTPFSTPFMKRRQVEQDATSRSTASFLPQHNQVYSLDNDPLMFLRPPVRTRRPRRRLVLHNKAPMWNEASQVYQLDFGGRVTQESAKNFQIEYKGKQVMQFGRIDTNAYTLDFQYPFTAVQAFAVALANVTQRLK